MKNFQVFDNDIDNTALEYYLQCGAIAVDTETMGLIPRRDRLCLVQICDASDCVSLVRMERSITNAPHLKKLMEAPDVTKVFHFARFDVGMLKAYLHIATFPIFCTKIASKLARTYTDKHGLKDLIKELEQVELDKTSQSSDWGSVYELSEAQLQYAANDVRYLLSVRKKLIEMLKREERYELALASFNYLPTLVNLDLLGYEDVFRH
jgi:ribonuclease D